MQFDQGQSVTVSRLVRLLFFAALPWAILAIFRTWVKPPVDAYLLLRAQPTSRSLTTYIHYEVLKVDGIDSLSLSDNRIIAQTYSASDSGLIDRSAKSRSLLRAFKGFYIADTSWQLLPAMFRDGEFTTRTFVRRPTKDSISLQLRVLSPDLVWRAYRESVDTTLIIFGSRICKSGEVAHMGYIMACPP